MRPLQASESEPVLLSEFRNVIGKSVALSATDFHFAQMFKKKLKTNLKIVVNRSQTFFQISILFFNM
jgi:hypothetical protein